jgi:hypothetical protein
MSEEEIIDRVNELLRDDFIKREQWAKDVSQSLIKNLLMTQPSIIHSYLNSILGGIIMGVTIGIVLTLFM